ncbi:hypothetical protein A5736_18470 [Mycobacterium sp. SP-6446]|nr:hypothetical protein A5736_18470 [Mycobacterium sp. SP-6446]
MLTVGSVVAGYRIERVLGAGGMGTVYLARDPDLPRSDALKVLSPELSRDPDFRVRFQREADVAAGLDHPNIVAIRRRGEYQGQLWIAMQFIDGTDADAALRAGTMTPARAVHIVGEVGKALDYAHHHNVVHRDVKPENFLLSQATSGDERVLLADFGIARALDATGRLTSAGVVLATVAYAAPEVLAGSPFDGRADLYSLGCTLFRMLTGRLPFPATNGMAAVMMAHLMQSPPKVTEQNPQLPVRLDQVIATAMAKDPAQRFQTARQLADAAAEALNDSTTPLWVPHHPVRSSEVIFNPNSLPGPNSSPWWQRPGPYTPMAPMPGSSHYLPQLRTPLPSAHPVPKPQRRARVWIAVAGVATIVVAAIAAIALNRDSDITSSPTTSESAASSPPQSQIAPPTVATSLLRGLLLSPDEVSTITSGPTMWADPVSNNLFDDAAHMSDKNCVGAWLPAQAVAYTGAGWDGVEAQKLRPAGVEVWQQGVIQAVVGFSTTTSAQKFLADQTNAWKTCSGRSFTVTPPNSPPQHWTFGQANVVDDTTGIPMTTGDGGSCQRALAVRRNVVIDVIVCGNDAGNLAGAVVGKIAVKVGQA